MKKKYLFISLFILIVTQTYAQLNVGDTFNDGSLSYKVENLSPLEATVTGFSGIIVTNLIIPSTASTGTQTFSVVGVGANAFQASGVVTVEFPSSLRSIEDFAFQGNGNSLTSFNLTNPSSLTFIGRSVFAGCSSLQSADLSGISVNFPSTSNSIFNNCTSLTSFTMKNNTAATTIPPVFLGTCSSMTVADFSGCTNITSFGDNVFRNNTSLVSLYLGTDTQPLITIGSTGTFAFVNGGGFTNINRTLKVPTSTGVSNYSIIPEWTDVFANIQPQKIQPQVTERPLIWAKNSEKQFILDEINNNAWKNNYYTLFTNRVNTELTTFASDRQGYLSQLPFDTNNAIAGQIPPLKTITDGQANASQDRNKYKHYLQSGIDSGVLYYLTNNEDYAKYSASVFYTFMKAMNQVPLSSSTSFNAGWIYPLDHLRESRDIGAQMPVLYDFIANYIKNGGTAYDFATNNEVTIDWIDAETIFKKYIFLAKERGGINSNWPALESASLASNILALDSEAERDTELQYIINKRATRQIPLSVMSQKIENNDGIWPEPFTYSKYVAEFSTYLMAMLTKYNSSYNLVDKYSNLPLSLDTPNDFSYPNGNRTLHFGDGSRGYNRYTNGYEMAYYLGKLTDDTVLLDKYGKLINSSIDYGNYQRQTLSSQRSTAVEPYYNEPLRLLWFSGTVDGASSDFEQNVTNKLSFAGISLQRNLETPNPIINGLMLFVGGAGYVHSYASGMNMELYGPKTVIGVAAGNTKNYTSTIHRNYYRLFAAHNTVIVNGASQGSGGNAGIDINSVEKLAIEPEYRELPVSPKNSFSTSSFRDDKGTLAEALQYRTMAIVRTSPTTGYYVDVFKSNSSLTNEYHDYVYHNLSDALLLQNNNSDIPLTNDTNRYVNGNTVGGFNNPGWQYFNDIQTSGIYTNDVTATFTATRLGGLVNMKMIIPGGANREYTRVNAPPTIGISSSYQNTPTPTVVIRQNGEAWNSPFAVIYEPYYGADTNSVNNVTNIKRDGIFTGLEVESTVGGKNIKQIILIRDNDNGIFNDLDLNIEFTGRFAVLSLDDNEALTSIYMGKGSHIKYKGWDITSQTGDPTSFYINIVNNNAEITTNSELVYTYPSNIAISGNILINNGTLTTDDNEFSNSKESFIFYKNETSNNWNLNTKNIEINNTTNLKILNLLGMTILNKKINSTSTEIDLSYVSNGLYIVQITNNNSVIASKKVIIRN